MWWPDDEDGGERHVEWARWSQALLIAPATASCIGSLAQGLFDNCVTLVAGNMPPSRWLICPAMAQPMWDQESVRDNARKLQSWGATFLGPQSGQVASGDHGQRMLEPEAIAQLVETWWQKLG
jgi:phosphopantothenoylcysteine decarboxylase/phosphopantothenate--cysteine ligase